MSRTTRRSITLGIGLDKFLSAKLSIFSYPSVLTNVLGAQKNRYIEVVLLNTHNISFGLRNKIFFFGTHS